MNTAKTNISKLPDYCYNTDNITGELIKLKAGESGYYRVTNLPSSMKAKSPEELADELNTELGVTKPQREAMEWGSMFGWETAMANPDNYDAEGNAIHPIKTEY